MLDLSPREKAVFAPLLLLVRVDGRLPRAVSGADPADRRRTRRAGRRRYGSWREPTEPRVIPAKAGIHLLDRSEAAQWVPAFRRGRPRQGAEVAS